MLSIWTISDFCCSILSFQGYYNSDSSSHTRLCAMKRWKESWIFLVGHCCLWIFPTESEHEINPFSGIMFGSFQSATSLSRITNRGSKHTIHCNQRLSQAASVALQKSPTNLFPSLLSLLKLFWTTPHKAYAILESLSVHQYNLFWSSSL